MTLHAELRAERAHLDASRAALRRMRERAERLYRSGDGVGGDPFSAEALGVALARRIAELADNPDTPLFFGRLNHTTESEQHGESFHIGRRHVTDAAGDPMVIDWRAPVSRSFYRASAAEPMGVAVRRRYGFVAGELTGFEDERLAAGQELGTTSRILTNEIERPRVGPMRDIVATIQPEQDYLVRAELGTSLCVQGAPGTGKTAVGLHRAAYLLYNHRERLRKAGVLVVGPNAAFLSYIAAVLPALGEVEVEQRTMDEVVAHVPVRAADSAEAARIKHDARMARVLHRALYGQLAEPTEPLVVPDGAARWRLSAEALRRIIDDARAEGLPYATGRERVRARVAAALRRRAEARGESPGEAWLRRVGRSAPVRDFLDACWPAVTPAGLVADLLGDQARLAAAADGILTGAEQAAIAWAKPARGVKSARFSAADGLLIDEAAGLCERLTSFGHVVVDEAQDLSAMQCRALARRSEHGSITVLGDLAQGTTPWAARHWTETLAHLGKPDTAVVALTTGFRVPASVLATANRLLPALAVDVPAATSLRHDGAMSVHSVVNVDAAVPDAARAALALEGSIGVIAADTAIGGLRHTLRSAGLPVSDIGAGANPANGSNPAHGSNATNGSSSANSANRSNAADSTNPAGGGPDGSVGSVVHDSSGGSGDSTAARTAIISDATNSSAGAGSAGGSRASGSATPSDGQGLGRTGGSDVDGAGRLTLVPASLAKGLEFDHVIVVEPAGIVAAEPRGLHRLYVVLTRAVSRLVVLHSRPLPSALTEPGSSGP